MKRTNNTNTRRHFLRNTLTGMAGAPFVPDWLRKAAENGPDVTPAEQSASTTRPLASRHRNLFNGDSCVFFYNPELWLPETFTMQTVTNPRTGKLNATPTPEGGPFSEKAIHRYVQMLANNGIDTVVINANASRAWYPSKTIPGILDGYKRGDRDFFRGHAICLGLKKPEEVDAFIDSIMPFMHRYQDLLDAGIDWLAETARACRHEGVSPWVSIRMNDMHGAGNFTDSFYNVPLLKQPDMRLQHVSYGLINSPTRQGLNYERAAVRAFMFEQIREVVEDYDFEGLELDWWRNPLCCEPNASAQTVTMMTDWLYQVRELTQRQARKTGRPYPLGLHIPGRLGTLKSIGLDVVTLCREGIIDFISPSNFWCTTWDMPYDTLRQQVGDRVVIYGAIEDGTNTLPALDPKQDKTLPLRYLSASPQLMHGNAAGKLAMGADGIEWFNFYSTDIPRVPGLHADYPSLKNIDNLDYLRGQPKQYSFGIGGRNYNMLPFDLPAQLPVTLDFNANHAFRVAMCAEPEQSGLDLTVQVVVKADEEVSSLAVLVNGCWPNLKWDCTEKLLFACGPLTHFTNEHVGYNYRFPVSLVRDGWNEVVVENAGIKPVTVIGIELAVRGTVG